MTDTRRSKRLSYWLRHAPETVALQLDSAGWAQTEAVLKALETAGLLTTMKDLEALVASNDKQRFELTPDKRQIRARQGHSIDIQGDWPVAVPPEVLYHGTAERFVQTILEQGLMPGKRHHVHLSSKVELAEAVGRRKGHPAVLAVAAHNMGKDGFSFRLSSNGVWLADYVPPAYLRRVD